MKNKDIKYLFEPRSIAVIGASRDKNKIGYKITENLINGGYKGEIHPVNPNAESILCLKSYKNINEIKGEIDIACIAIPAQFVFDAVKSCARKKVKFVTIISSGFSEIGNTKEEENIVSFAKKKGMRILGPNIFGIYSSKASLNATFGPSTIRSGNVGIITQSGALGLSMIGKTAFENIGLSAIVSVGNKSDIDEVDLLEYLTKDENTKIILIYLEGVKEGDKLIKSLKEATSKKPLIIIKAGRSRRGAIAAASHTGSLAGSDKIFNDIMRQCGVLRAESIKQAFNWCKFLSTTHTQMPSGENTIIITNGGGIGVIATDACEKYGIKLYDNENALKKIFSDSTPAFGSTKNPIDLTGQATSLTYNTALGSALKDTNIHSVIALYCETALFDVENLVKMIKDNCTAYSANKKPIIFSIFGGEGVEKSIITLRQHNIPIFDDVYDAVSCLGGMFSYYRYLKESKEEKKEARRKVKQSIDGRKIRLIDSIAAKALRQKRMFFIPEETQRVMNAVRIAAPKSLMAKNVNQALYYAETIGYPVALKIVSKDILHKSDVKGVILDLKNKKEVEKAYNKIIQNCKSKKPQPKIEGIEVTQMAKHGTEVIIGLRRDKTYGPIVMFGLGGINVEILKDVSFRAIPFTEKDVTKMMREIKSYPLLLGLRGRKESDIKSIKEIIYKLSGIISKCKNISDIEINPLFVYEKGKGVMAVDVRIFLAEK